MLDTKAWIQGIRWRRRSQSLQIFLFRKPIIQNKWKRREFTKKKGFLTYYFHQTFAEAAPDQSLILSRTYVICKVKYFTFYQWFSAQTTFSLSRARAWEWSPPRWAPPRTWSATHWGWAGCHCLPLPKTRVIWNDQFHSTTTVADMCFDDIPRTKHDSFLAHLS